MLMIVDETYFSLTCVLLFFKFISIHQNYSALGAKKLSGKAILSSFCKCGESVKLERRKKLKHVFHNDCCCIKKQFYVIKLSIFFFSYIIDNNL